MKRLRAALGRLHLNVFAVVEHLLTFAALVLVAITVGGEVGTMLGLTGPFGTAAAWSIAIVFDALWIGALRMSEQAIRQRSRVGMVVMIGLSVVAVATSTAVLLTLGHAEVFAAVPVAAAVFMGLRLFADNVLADAGTTTRIADQSAEDRNARALAAADARHLAVAAVTDVVTETAGQLAETRRQVARAKALTGAQVRIDKARAKAEEKLRKAAASHGKQAQAFACRDLVTAALPSGVTAEATPPVTPRVAPGVTPRVTPVMPEIEAASQVAETPVTPPVEEPVTPVAEPPVTPPVETVQPVADPADLETIAAVAGVETPRPDESLSDDQLIVVLRWLRHAEQPPRSYRKARAAFSELGYVGGERRIRTAWAVLEDAEQPGQQ